MFQCSIGECKDECTLTCAGCDIKKYCSSYCQRKGWKEHKKICKKYEVGHPCIICQVFVYNGNTYKLTGAFAPLNQILGIFKFSR